MLSTRRGGFTRCNGPWEPIAVYTLHRMDADGKRPPCTLVARNERVAPERAPRRPDCLLPLGLRRSVGGQLPRAVDDPPGRHPGGDALRQLHVADLRLLPALRRAGLQADPFRRQAHTMPTWAAAWCCSTRRAWRGTGEAGEDRFDALEVLTPEVCFPEGNGKDGGWPKSYFHAPQPLSENYYLVGFCHGKLPGMNSGGKVDTTGIYYFDRFGNLELLYRDAAIASTYPLLLRPRPAAPVIASTLDPELGDEGELLLTDVTRSHFALPAGRPVRSLRIFQVLPKTTPTAEQAADRARQRGIGADAVAAAVPVEADGSAYFRVPARKPLYFQAVDGEGRAVQSMRSVVYLQPGERRSCVGCHERPGSAPSPRAVRWPLPGRPPPSGPVRTAPGRSAIPRLVQPVLDRHCVRCHDGTKGPDKGSLALTGEAEGTFTRSYNALRPYLRWYEWGGGSITQATTHPGRIGADESRLTKVLADRRHAAALNVPRGPRAAPHLAGRQRAVLRHLRPRRAAAATTRRSRSAAARPVITEHWASRAGESARPAKPPSSRTHGYPCCPPPSGEHGWATFARPVRGELEGIARRE